MSIYFTETNDYDHLIKKIKSYISVIEVIMMDHSMLYTIS